MDTSKCKISRMNPNLQIFMSQRFIKKQRIGIIVMLPNGSLQLGVNSDSIFFFMRFVS